MDKTSQTDEPFFIAIVEHTVHILSLAMVRKKVLVQVREIRSLKEAVGISVRPECSPAVTAGCILVASLLHARCTSITHSCLSLLPLIEIHVTEHPRYPEHYLLKFSWRADRNADVVRMCFTAARGAGQLSLQAHSPAHQLQHVSRPFITAAAVRTKVATKVQRRCK